MPGPRTRVLLVEDDADVRRALGLSLADHGYEVVPAATAREALVSLPDVDAVLLDLTLPDVDGVALCRRIRASGPVPVIMVTGRSGSDEVVAGLEAGADDYVTKPVVGRELAARVDAVLRRTDPRHTERLAVGDLELQVHEGTVRRGGRPVHLTRTELHLLAALAAQAGRTVSREQLLQQVWGYDYFGDTRLLDVHVRRLRAKVEDDPASPSLVTTVRGVGYRLIPQTRESGAPESGVPTG